LFGPVGHLAHWLYSAASDPGKKLSSTMQQFTTVTKSHHMLSADHASPLLWSRSTALFQLWKHVVGPYDKRCLICGFLTCSLLPYWFNTENTLWNMVLKMVAVKQFCASGITVPTSFYSSHAYCCWRKEHFVFPFKQSHFKCSLITWHCYLAQHVWPHSVLNRRR
jgi:hypothetical protein